jgi:pimeloyl-ACP methyl ester carboxylesterase
MRTVFPSCNPRNGRWSVEPRRPGAAEVVHCLGRALVVLVPCSASSARQWKPLVDQLAGFQPVPLDLWGHGDQRRWHGAHPLSLAEEAAAIHQACPDGAPIHLVGHSYGGGVALRFALSHPRRLLSLTLIEPSAFHVLKEVDASEAPLLDEIRAVAEAVNRGVICGDYASGMQTFIDYWGGTGSWDSLPEDKKAKFMQLAVHVAHHFWGLIEEKTLLAAYAAIDVPTLIVSGTLSPAPSRAITRLLAEALPRARHRTIRNAGHMSPITHPAEVNALVLEHLLMNGPPAGVGLPIAEAADVSVGDSPQGLHEARTKVFAADPGVRPRFQRRKTSMPRLIRTVAPVALAAGLLALASGREPAETKPKVDACAKEEHTPCQLGLPIPASIPPRAWP